MGTTPSVLDQAIARTLGSSQGSSPGTPSGSAPPAPATATAPVTGGDVLDSAISRALGNKPAQPPPLTQEQGLSRTLDNMTRAMSGQPMANPEDQAEAEKGRKAGTIAGGLTLATGALAGPLAAPAVGAEQVGTGILDASGQEIMREVMKYGPSVARQVFSHPLAQQVLKYAAGAAGGGWILKTLGVLGK